MNAYKEVLYIASASLLLSTSTLLAAEKSALNIMKKAFQHTGSMER